MEGEVGTTERLDHALRLASWNDNLRAGATDAALDELRRAVDLGPGSWVVAATRS